jgi:hypothetical protein
MVAGSLGTPFLYTFTDAGPKEINVGILSPASSVSLLLSA